MSRRRLSTACLLTSVALGVFAAPALAQDDIKTAPDETEVEEIVVVGC